MAVIQILLFCSLQQHTSCVSFLLPSPNFPSRSAFILSIIVFLVPFSYKSYHFHPLAVFLFPVSLITWFSFPFALKSGMETSGHFSTFFSNLAIENASYLCIFPATYKDFISWEN